MRIFLAIDLPDSIKSKISNLLRELSRYSHSIRLTPINNLHLTLKFLGEQNEFAVEHISRIAKETAMSRSGFRIDLNRSGFFGPLYNPKILWLGGENKEFVSMAEELNKSLEAFRPEEHKPVCHLTIGRIKGLEKAEALEVLRTCREFVKNSDLSFVATRIHLYKSTLYRSGAVYEKLKTFSMRG